MNITGLENLNVDEIECYSLKTNNISNNEINTLKGSNINLTLQSQINTLNNFVSSGNTGGGFFSILCGSSNGFVSVNPYWNFGGSGVSNANVPIVHNFDFKVNSISFTCQSVPTTQATVYLYKNGSIVYTMPNINALTYTFYNMNVLFSAGDKLNLYTYQGGGGGSVRCTISCSVGGVVGPSPTFSIGTITSLASNEEPTVSLTGNSLNPVLNFGLVQGIQGIQGPQGPQGAQGQQGPQGPGSGELSATGVSALAYIIGVSPLPNPILASYLGPDGLNTGLNNCVYAIGTVLNALVLEVDGPGGIVSQIGTIDSDIEALQGKTQFITANLEGNSTSISSSLNVGNNLFKIDSTTGNMENRGNFTLRNSGGSSSIVLSSNDGIITANSISTPNIQETATTATFGQTDNTSTYIQGNNIYLGGYLSTVYINGLPFSPWSATSSFFSQWY